MNFRDPLGLCVQLMHATEKDHARVEKGLDQYCSVPLSLRTAISQSQRRDPFADGNAVINSLMSSTDAMLVSLQPIPISNLDGIPDPSVAVLRTPLLKAVSCFD